MKIGVLDSGVGGFTVARPLLQRFPDLSIVYVADTAHVPYSDKSPDELQIIIRKILRFFSGEKVDAVVFACNTSSALVLPAVRSASFAPFFGVVEPGVRGALKVTGGKGIGVAANAVTAKSGVFRKLIHEKNAGIPVIEQPCGQLVPFVEAGDLESDAARLAVEECCKPFVGNIDTLIFGCTHFPFLEKQFARVLPGVTLVDPSTLLVEEFAAMLGETASLPASPQHRLLATKPSPHVGEWARKVLGWNMEAEWLKIDKLEPWRAEPAFVSEKGTGAC